MKVYRRRDVEELTGLSKSTLYQKMSEGTFPRPIRLGKRAVGWSDAALREWLSSLKGAEES